MTFTEPLFLFYLALCVVLNRLCPAPGRAAFLLFASYAFYFTWSPPAAAILAVLTLVTFAAGLSLTKTKAIAPVLAILLTIYLMAFKVALLTPSHGIAGLIMPLGISYYSFKLISYVLDVHWGKIPPEKSYVNFAAYVAFFPQIVAGPIQRPGDFFAQLPPKPSGIVNPILRIAWGLLKKLMIADNLAPAVNAIYGHVTNLHGAPLWAAFYLFPLQLYADFSGLTDIAIGSGQLFGITGPENFNRPFTASSISDFWRRWHMSLTTWLGDYVFVPLRMASRRAGAWGLSFSIAVNMVAIGLWHGLTGSYLVFGLLNAAYLILDTLTNKRRAKFFKQNRPWDRAGTWLGWLLTFHLIFIAEVFFRAPHVSDALWLLSHLVTSLAGSGELLHQIVEETGQHSLLVGLVGYLFLEWGERFRPDLWLRDVYSTGPRWLRWSFCSSGVMASILFLALFLVHAAGKRAPFLYEIF